MKILDRYIIRKFLGTFGFMLALLSVIVVVIDLQSKAPRIESNGYSIGYFLFNFYPFWLLYMVVTFLSILIFISVIYFTSRMANDTEIVAIISGGVSFYRFSRPYLYAALFLAGFTLLVNHFLLPMANVQKNKLEYYTYNAKNKKKFTDNAQISSQLAPLEFVFINSYNRQQQKGSGYLYQKFDEKRRLVHQLSASDIAWDEKKQTFVLSNYYERILQPSGQQVIKSDAECDQSLGASPEELFPNELLGQNKTTPDLMRFIQREKAKGNSNIVTFQNELNMRSSMPFSIILLTFLALSLSSQKRRGGLGINLAIGISLAFVFVFSFEMLKVISSNGSLPSLLAMWLPNIVFTPLTIYLYWKRANE